MLAIGGCEFVSQIFMEVVHSPILSHKLSAGFALGEALRYRGPLKKHIPLGLVCSRPIPKAPSSYKMYR